eukprot:7464111-Pyramimonas_sp.AAC.1
MCDLKPYCRKFLKQNFGGAANPDLYIWESMADAVQKAEYCHNHETDIPKIVAPSRKRRRQKYNEDPNACDSPDIVVGGPPCQPYSPNRQGRSTPDSAPHAHPDYGAIFDDGTSTNGSYIGVLRRKLPKVAVLEEVPGFMIQNGSNASEFTKFVNA